MSNYGNIEQSFQKSEIKESKSEENNNTTFIKKIFLALFARVLIQIIIFEILDHEFGNLLISQLGVAILAFSIIGIIILAVFLVVNIDIMKKPLIKQFFLGVHFFGETYILSYVGVKSGNFLAVESLMIMNFVILFLLILYVYKMSQIKLLVSGVIIIIGSIFNLILYLIIPNTDKGVEVACVIMVGIYCFYINFDIYLIFYKNRHHLNDDWDSAILIIPFDYLIFLFGFFRDRTKKF